MAHDKSKKAARTAAAEAELARRQNARIESCPLDHDQFCALLEHLAERIHEAGHESRSLAITEEWISKQNVDKQPVLVFLKSEGFSDDWDIAVRADPYQLFGPGDGRRSRMSLERAELAELMAALANHLAEHKCSNKLEFTEEWLRQRSKPVALTSMELLAQGGGCDCEVILNVEPENLYE